MRWWTRSAWVPVLLMACGGEGVPTDSGAGLDAGQADAAVTACERDRDCADALFCNGEERCMPGAEGVDARGCVAGAPACAVDCDEERDLCSGCDTDADGDGEIARACGGTDCDDEDAAVRSGADEVCDDAGLDEDCNHETIQSEIGDGDEDGDGHVATRCFNVRLDGSENRGTDCDDAVAGVHPGAADGCGGGDEDCDGEVDEDVEQLWYLDGDGDGWGDADASVRACFAPARHVNLPGDCDDSERDVNPDEPEACNGLDDDCDGSVDEAGRTFCRDDDGDGYGTPADCLDGCVAPPGFVDNEADCHDGDPTIFRNAITYVAEPFCTSGHLCETTSGWDCTSSPPAADGTCAAGATSVATPSFDADCNGVVSPTPMWSLAGQPCAWDGAACNVYPPYPTASHVADDCGRLVPHTICAMTGAGACGWVESPRPLECH